MIAEQHRKPIVLLSVGVLVLWLCWPEPSSEEGEPQSAQYLVPQLSEIDLQKCLDLNQLEATADKLLQTAADPSERAAAIEAWQSALASWRQAHPGPQPACRTEVLGREVCSAGARLPLVVPSGDGGRMTVWDESMTALRQTFQESTRCQQMGEKFHTDQWEPTVFSWTLGQPLDIVKPIYLDAEYDAFYARAAHLAPAYGPPQWQRYQYDGKMWNKKRLQNLVHLQVLRSSLPGWRFEDLEQVVEFGGGTGDLAAAFHDLGFRGTHVVLDMPPMNLLHLYWHRFSGLPSVLGSTLPCSVDAARHLIVLESSAEGSPLHCHIDRAVLDRSLFFATWSLTEADVATRHRIYPLIKSFGTILISFYAGWDGIDNEEYLQTLLDEGLDKSHHVLSWKAHWGGGFYLLARRRDLGEVVCSVEADCHLWKYHFLLSRQELQSAALMKLGLLTLFGVPACALVYLLGGRRSTGGETYKGA